MKTLLRVTAYGFRCRRLFITAAVLHAVSSFPHVAIPRLLGTAIDETLTSGLQRELLILGGLILLVTLLRAVLVYLSLYLGEATGHWVAYYLRNDLFSRLQKLSLGFYDKQQTGDLMSRATVDVDAIYSYIGFGVLTAFSGLTIFGSATTVMLLIDWRLGLITLGFLPIIIWLSTRMTMRMNPLFTRAHQETGAMNAVVQENIAGIRVVKAFGARDFEAAKFRERADAVATNFYAAGKVFVPGQSMIAFLFAAATAVILLIGGREVSAGRITTGELVSFVLYLGLLGYSVMLLGWRVQVFSRAIAAGRRIFEILDSESPVEERPAARDIPRVQGHVKFEHASLSYDVSKETLRDIDFEVQPGQTVAILGGPGSGKSTIVHMLPRFYEVSSGRVLIDGTDVREASLASLRRNVGIVLQDAFAFSATIRDNIAYGSSDAHLDEVVRAAKVAQLHDFIEGLSDSYDTWVGERGITLSGGQRQRLAIARTIMLDPPILVLDDSTSSVDVGTEALIQRALVDVVKGRTTFIIAHRLSTVRNADLILVLDRGRIVERGAHKELLEKDGYYRRIYDLQIRPQEDIRRLGPQTFTGETSR